MTDYQWALNKPHLLLSGFKQRLFLQLSDQTIIAEEVKQNTMDFLFRHAFTEEEKYVEFYNARYQKAPNDPKNKLKAGNDYLQYFLSTNCYNNDMIADMLFKLLEFLEETNYNYKPRKRTDYNQITENLAALNINHSSSVRKRKVAWTDSETQILLDALETFERAGVYDKFIAASKLLPGRTNVQCKDRARTLSSLKKQRSS